MAHFAQLDENNIVLQVIVVSNSCCLNKLGLENEAVGIEFCRSHYGDNTNWVQTSYNGSFRRRYAGRGYRYDAAADAFIAPQPFPSWTLTLPTLDWEPPVPYPTDRNDYYWDEGAQAWVFVETTNG